MYEIKIYIILNYDIEMFSLVFIEPRLLNQIFPSTQWELHIQRKDLTTPWVSLQHNDIKEYHTLNFISGWMNEN